VRVVQLAGLGQLALAADGRVETAQVGQRGGEGQTVQHLRTACKQMGVESARVNQQLRHRNLVGSLKLTMGRP
jgi:hypothetical protein